MFVSNILEKRMVNNRHNLKMNGVHPSSPALSRSSNASPSSDRSAGRQSRFTAEIPLKRSPANSRRGSPRAASDNATLPNKLKRSNHLSGSPKPGNRLQSTDSQIQSLPRSPKGRDSSSMGPSKQSPRSNRRGRNDPAVKSSKEADPS